MIRLYKFKNFEIYGYKNVYIIYNKNKEFENGHTHINNFKTAKYLIKLSYYKIIPKHLSSYLFKSLVRISNDELYLQKLNQNKNKIISKKSQ